MSAIAARRWLWLFAFGALPVPIGLLGPGWVPAAQIGQLGAAALAFGLAESLRGVVGWTAAILLGQSVAWALAWWLVAGALARRLGRLRGAVVALAAVLVLVACFVAVYRSPYHATLARTTLLEVYQ